MLDSNVVWGAIITQYTLKHWHIYQAQAACFIIVSLHFSSYYLFQTDLYYPERHISQLDIVRFQLLDMSAHSKLRSNCLLLGHDRFLLRHRNQQRRLYTHDLVYYCITAARRYPFKISAWLGDVDDDLQLTDSEKTMSYK